MRGRFPLFFFAGFALVSLVGCRADVEVAIEVDESGRGTVAVVAELDEAAADRMGDLSQLVAADDLRAAGWDVVAGERKVEVKKPVDSPAEIEVAIAELSGPAGPFADLNFDRNTTFARTEVEFGGFVDLSEGMAAFGDEELKQLTGSVSGVDVPVEAVRLSLAVDLPGAETSNAPGPGTRWALPWGAVTPINAESTDVNVLGLGGVAVAVGAGLILIGAVVRRFLPR